MLQENNNCVIDTEMRDIMGKSVYIAEKPSVAQEFAKALHVNFTRKDGYLEGGDHIVTWCVGHLVTMSYPDAYDPNLKDGALTHCHSYQRNSSMRLYLQLRNMFNIS